MAAYHYYAERQNGVGAVDSYDGVFSTPNNMAQPGVYKALKESINKSATRPVEDPSTIVIKSLTRLD